MMKNQAWIERANEFELMLNSWLKGAQDIINTHWIDSKSNYPAPVLELQFGSRYIKVIRKDINRETNLPNAGGSVHAFIDKNNGDILLPASYKMPAKKSRGNIFDDRNGLAKMSWTGPAYLH